MFPRRILQLLPLQIPQIIANHTSSLDRVDNPINESSLGSDQWIRETFGVVCCLFLNLENERKAGKKRTCGVSDFAKNRTRNNIIMEASPKTTLWYLHFFL